VRVNLNGRDLELPESMGERRLILFLREDIDLTGAKNACDIGACGACTILIDDEPAKICIKRVKDVAGKRVLTIEGMAAPDGRCTRCSGPSSTAARSSADSARRA
jgi:aerobic-type carbon monoxide dehydrogenase small subunit (CoxS/CutS family)